MSEKKCAKCFVMKPYDEFWNNAKNKDGKSKNCSVCATAYLKQRVAERKKERQEWDERNVEKNKKKNEAVKMETEARNWSDNWVSLGQKHWIDLSKLKMVAIDKNEEGSYKLIFDFSDGPIEIDTNFTDKSELEKLLKSTLTGN